ncbi:hypothetical protein AKJ09_01207 [Labilithrix luteola]|uniref:DUF790 family protein n=1 Tax=Labilithrix luteola TaxID=1391654 RepID=A0A0K1PLX8_9BACT|nr:hypothetical protein AKJ09_01207 [Labilithrix luteola]
MDDDRVVPRWLGPRDETTWLLAMYEELADFAGLSVAEADERVRMRVGAIARNEGIVGRVPLAVWTVERRRWTAHVASPVPPERLRSIVFDLAAVLPRDEALERASRELGLSPASIVEALFADRSAQRRLSAPDRRLDPIELGRRYNLALAQTLVMRSSELVVTVARDAQTVVRAAKARRLMTCFETTDDARMKLVISGPLALFHATSKYRRALAELLAVLASTTGWTAHALVSLENEWRLFELSDGAPIRTSGGVPEVDESNLERRLAVDLDRLGPYRLERENVILKSGNRLHVPDFTVVGPNGRVRVEVVSHWTPTFLETKRALLRSFGEPLLLCVDARDDESVPEGPDVVSFRGRIDAATLVAAAERLLSPSACPSRAPPRDEA